MTFFVVDLLLLSVLLFWVRWYLFCLWNERDGISFATIIPMDLGNYDVLRQMRLISLQWGSKSEICMRISDYQLHCPGMLLFYSIQPTQSILWKVYKTNLNTCNRLFITWVNMIYHIGIGIFHCPFVFSLENAVRFLNCALPFEDILIFWH